MSSEHKPPDDGELEDFLAGRHPVGRAYRQVSENETAPRELDDAILKMARAHATSPSVPAMPRRRPRWLQPLAVAATLALSLGVLMNVWRDPVLREQAVPVGEEDLDLRDEPTQSPAAPSPQELAPEGGTTLEQRRQTPVEVAPTEDPRFDSYSRLERENAPAHEKRARPLESRRAEPFPAVEAVPPSATSPRAASSDATAAPPPPPPPSPAVQAGPVSQPAAGGAAVSRPDIDPRALDHDDAGDPPVLMKKSTGAIESREAGALAEQAEQKEPKAAVAPGMAKEKSALQDSVSEEAAAGAEIERAAQELDERDRLIELARAARARGDIAEARRIVVELRRMHPDAPLPEDLRDLAPPPAP